jgi:hypothetical protein
MEPNILQIKYICPNCREVRYSKVYNHPGTEDKFIQCAKCDYYCILEWGDLRKSEKGHTNGTQPLKNLQEKNKYKPTLEPPPRIKEKNVHQFLKGKKLKDII